MPIPFEQLPIGEGLDPMGNPGAAFFINRSELEAFERDGPEWKYDDARFIDEAVKAPDAIFERLNRPKQLDGLCYSVRPTLDPDEEGELDLLPRYGYVFVAFARRGMGGYVVFDWEWRKEHADDPGHPANWGEDFERRTWHKT
jgi:hypothetical protein